MASIDTSGFDEAEEIDTSGWDEFIAGAAAAMSLPGVTSRLQGLTEAVGPMVSGTAGLEGFGERYSRGKEEADKLIEQAKKEHPIASAVGGIAQTAPLAALGTPGFVGGEMALGAIGSKASPVEDPRQFARDVAIPGMIGTVTSGVAPLASYLHNQASKKLPDLYTYLARRHLRPTPGMTREFGQEGVNEAAREAVESGSIGFGAKAADTAEQLSGLADDLGALKGSMVEASDKTIDAGQMITKINGLIDKYRGVAEYEPIVKSLERKKAAFMRTYMPKNMGGASQGYPLSASQIEAEKTAIQSNINYRADTDAAIRAQQEYGRVFREAGEDLVTDPAFKRVKDAYGNIVRAGTMADRTGALTDGGGLMQHMTDVGMGAGLAKPLLEGNPKAIGLAAARAATRGRLASAGAVTTLNASRILERVASSPMATKFLPPLQAAMQRGGDSFASTYFLMFNTDPEFQKAMNEKPEDESSRAEGARNSFLEPTSSAGPELKQGYPSYDPLKSFRDKALEFGVNHPLATGAAHLMMGEFDPSGQGIGAIFSKVNPALLSVGGRRVWGALKDAAKSGLKGDYFDRLVKYLSHPKVSPEKASRLIEDIAGEAREVVPTPKGPFVRQSVYGYGQRLADAIEKQPLEDFTLQLIEGGPSPLRGIEASEGLKSYVRSNLPYGTSEFADAYKEAFGHEPSMHNPLRDLPQLSGNEVREKYFGNVRGQKVDILPGEGMPPRPDELKRLKRENVKARQEILDNPPYDLGEGSSRDVRYYDDLLRNLRARGAIKNRIDNKGSIDVSVIPGGSLPETKLSPGDGNKIFHEMISYADEVMNRGDALKAVTNFLEGKELNEGLQKILDQYGISKKSLYKWYSD